jgi:hypothetical protein
MTLALLPLVAAWILSTRAAESRWGRRLVGGADILALLGTAFLWTSRDADARGLFLAATVLGALVFAVLDSEPNADALCRLHLGASLALVASSTRELLWSVGAILLIGLLLRRERLFLAPGLVALSGLALLSWTDSERLGLVLLVLGLSTFWLLVSREVLRSSPSRLVTRVAASFLLLVAVFSVNLRIAESAPLGTMHALAFGGLGLGVLGTLGATRVTTFLTAFALARAGLMFLALPGGVHGRAPGLLALAASGVSLLLLAAALENVDVLDDVTRLRSAPRRLVLTWGALSAASFPPFPGFVAAFPLASALFDRGYLGSLVAAAALLFLLVLGSMRVVARAWDSEGARTIETGVGRVSVASLALSSWFFTIAPTRLVEIARAAGL